MYFGALTPKIQGYLADASASELSSSAFGLGSTVSLSRLLLLDYSKGA